MSNGKTWLKQAIIDRDWCLKTIENKFYGQACFVAQQIAEKTLKAIAYHRGADMVKSHSLLRICHDLKINDELERASKRLDLYYLATRYPDAAPDDMVPSERFDKEQAEEALGFADLFIEKAKIEIND